jgi:hypothetical protein
VSFSNRHTVRPEPSMRMVPSGSWRAATVVPAPSVVAAGGCWAPDESVSWVGVGVEHAVAAIPGRNFSERRGEPHTLRPRVSGGRFMRRCPALLARHASLTTINLEEKPIRRFASHLQLAAAAAAVLIGPRGYGARSLANTAEANTRQLMTCGTRSTTKTVTLNVAGVPASGAKGTKTDTTPAAGATPDPSGGSTGAAAANDKATGVRSRQSLSVGWHCMWSEEPLGEVDSAGLRRRVTVPASWPCVARSAPVDHRRSGGTSHDIGQYHDDAQVVRGRAGDHDRTRRKASPGRPGSWRPGTCAKSGTPFTPPQRDDTLPYVGGHA